MQIRKIVSGAQTGADRAALDFAIEYGIDYGGWVPRGRKAEDGSVPARYSVLELPEGGYSERTEKNVIDSDGTLIVSHGALAGGSRLTLEMTEKHEKACLHIDLNNIIHFDAAIDIHDWIVENRIKILNVAGPRASKDARIYKAVYDILEMVIQIDIITEMMPRIIKSPCCPDDQTSSLLPVTVEEAVDILMARLSPMDKIRIASAGSGDLDIYGNNWGKKVRRMFGLRRGNARLLEHCRELAGESDPDAATATRVILRALWEKLRNSGHLRVVK